MLNMYIFFYFLLPLTPLFRDEFVYMRTRMKGLRWLFAYYRVGFLLVV